MPLYFVPLAGAVTSIPQAVCRHSLDWPLVQQILLHFGHLSFPSQKTKTVLIDHHQLQIGNDSLKLSTLWVYRSLYAAVSRLAGESARAFHYNEYIHRNIRLPETNFAQSCKCRKCELKSFDFLEIVSWLTDLSHSKVSLLTSSRLSQCKYS